LDPLAKNVTGLGLWKLLAEAARAAPQRPRHGREGTRTALRMHQGLMLRNWGETTTSWVRVGTRWRNAAELDAEMDFRTRCRGLLWDAARRVRV